MRKGASHHSFDLRPSDAAALQEAGIVFLIDEAMETELAVPIDTLASDARIVELSAAEGLVRRPLREGGAFEADPSMSTTTTGATTTIMGTATRTSTNTGTGMARS